MSKNNPKAKVQARPVSPTAFVVAGWNSSRSESHTVALVKALSEKQVSEARADFLTGYVAGRMARQDVNTLSPAAVKAARAIVTKRGWKKTEPKAHDRRSQEQETLVNTAAKAWSRALHAAGIGRTDNRGRKNGVKVGPTKTAAGADAAAKTAPVTVKVGKVGTMSEAARTMSAIKQAFVSLMGASKALNLSNEQVELATQITVLMNRFETGLASK